MQLEGDFLADMYMYPSVGEKHTVCGKKEHLAKLGEICEGFVP